MGWTDEREAQLRELWMQGYSASVIADKLKGVSRSAVIGKAHRLGLARKNSATTRGSPATRSARSKAFRKTLRKMHEDLKRARAVQKAKAMPRPPRSSPVFAPTIEERASDTIGATCITDLGPGQCRYPVSDTERSAPKGWCGQETIAGHPYCAKHFARCYHHVPVRRHTVFVDRQFVKTA